MAFIAADKTGEITLFANVEKIERELSDNPQFCYWAMRPNDIGKFTRISKKKCKDLIGKVITWEDDPVEI